ncbi:MAG: 50S ribosomal protein L11 methyltransferase [Bacteroidetes bacterium]|nr:50S ribosomal protein L11 methyltransferase [Bacteroidota bacterium]MDA1119069.1 50S ribosomal protein L11 methyltransferase [Bacteroidota bacterium]
MDYLELQFTLPEEFRDILIAELSEKGYDTFLETEDGFNTYKDKLNFNVDIVEDVIAQYSEMCSIQYGMTTIPDKNWNEEWEKNFEPIVVEGKCLVRAPFHSIKKKYPLEILIDPKMAFGTGHHATTYLMLQEMMKLDFAGKTVIDLGSGTGILAIAAKKLGAGRVTATDINDWSINNSQNNFNINGIQDIELLCGEIKELQIKRKYDLVMANINRNVLLDEIPFYVTIMEKSAIMLLSGFYEVDEYLISEKVSSMGMSVKAMALKNDWVILVCSLNSKHS